MPRITPNLWFDTRGPGSRRVLRLGVPELGGHDHHALPRGGPATRPAPVLTVDFVLDGQEYTAINGGPAFTFNEAISLHDQLRRPG